MSPMKLPYLLTAALIVCITSIPALSFTGQVVAVTDGDTIKVMHDGALEKIRLNRIDCPEKSQPFGQRAKNFTSDACFGRIVEIQEHGTDRYHRTIGEVILPDGRDLNAELVRAGYAWWYRRYAPTDLQLSLLEQQARAQRSGLWADTNPIAPWDYRHPSIALHAH